MFNFRPQLFDLGNGFLGQRTDHADSKRLSDGSNSVNSNFGAVRKNDDLTKRDSAASKMPSFYETFSSGAHTDRCLPETILPSHVVNRRSKCSTNSDVNSFLYDL